MNEIDVTVSVRYVIKIVNTRLGLLWDLDWSPKNNAAIVSTRFSINDITLVRTDLMFMHGLSTRVQTLIPRDSLRCAGQDFTQQFFLVKNG